MSRARHEKKRAMGGGVKPVWNAGGEQNAAKEAEERKRGGKVMEGEGEMSKKRHDRPVRGRKRGGGVGCINLMPLSTAAKVSHVTKGEQPEEGDRSN